MGGKRGWEQCPYQSESWLAHVGRWWRREPRLRTSEAHVRAQFTVRVDQREYGTQAGRR